MNHKYLYKRRNWNEINAGVFHGIKRPKPPKLKRTKLLDKKENIKESSNDKRICQKDIGTQMIVDDTRANSKAQLNQKDILYRVTQKRADVFKISNVTDNSNNKSKETKNQNENNVLKKSMDFSLDGATDLKVDKPEIANIMKENNINDLLKVLENDWGNDDYDSISNLVNENNMTIMSSLKSNGLLNEVETTSSNELSEITSAMNIKETSDVTNISKNHLSLSVLNNDNNITKVEKENKEKYYPLFNKGYFMNNTENKSTKSTQGIKKGTTKWQLSFKGNSCGEDQYQLDAGQKRFGATQCTECGVIYQLGDPEDENAHLNYHNSVKILKFQGWKNERIIFEDSFTSSRIILVEPSDPKQYWKKVTEILNVVDRDLGLADSNYDNKQIYLYVRDKSVLGVLVAEYIHTAFRMIPELMDLNCCTAESTPAKCGINVVWTAMSHRRQGIATKLVNTLRAKYFYGYIMSLDDIAFSTPTPSGKLFAEKYTKSKNFKVYN